MGDQHTLMGIFEKIVTPMFKYAVPRIGKVVSLDDERKSGKVLATIPSLGWDTNDKAAWCFPSDKKAMVVPDVGSYVLIEWIDGNPDLPIYRGVPHNIKDQVVAAYDGEPKTNVLFQGSDNGIIKYVEDLLEIIMQSGITLNTGDASAWKPNVLTTDPFTGLPHGGPGAGIVKLKGE